MQTGLDRLLRDADRLARLRGQRVALEVFGAPDLQVDALLAHMRATWVDDPQAGIADWDQTLRIDEDAGAKERRPFLIYGWSRR